MNVESIKSALLVEIYNSLSANNTEDKILNFADVVSGWHFGEGASISASAIRDAMKLHNNFLMYGFYETDAFPGLAGEVRVTAYHGNQYFEFTREINGEWSYIYELDGAIEHELDGLTMEQAEETVKKVSNNIWNTYDIFQDSTGIFAREDFKASPFGHQPKEGFRLWKSLAPPPSGRSASTLGSSIPPRGSPLFSGFLRAPYYQTPLKSSNRQATQMTHVIEISSKSPAMSQRKYSGSSALNPMISKFVWETNQDSSALQISLPLDMPQD
jgi:hypothetical protein